MKFIRRYWAAGLILLMVAAHAGVIGYVRNRVSRLSNTKSPAIEIGEFRFQSVGDLSRIYQFKLHALVDPGSRVRATELLTRRRMEIREASEQSLRQMRPEALDDPAQVQIRDRLMEIVRKHLGEPVVQRMLITEWLELPTTLDTMASREHQPSAQIAGRP